MKGRRDQLMFCNSIRIKWINPDFAKPALTLGIEKACSNGCFTILENSLFVIMKFFYVKERALTFLEKTSLRDLKTATSRGCNAWVVCGG